MGNYLDRDGVVALTGLIKDKCDDTYVAIDGGLVQGSHISLTKGDDNKITIAAAGLITPGEVDTKISNALTSTFTYKGTITAASTTGPANHKVGDVYIVKITSGTINVAGHTCEKGDMLVCNTTGTTANASHWDVVQGNWTAIDGSSDLSWGSSVTLATIGGVSIDAKLPSTLPSHTHEYAANAFKTINIYSAGASKGAVVADSKEDTFTLDSNIDGLITLAADTTNDKVTISHSKPTTSPAKSSLGLYKLTIDAAGHITSAESYTDQNSDENVSYTAKTDNVAHPILFANNSSSTGNPTKGSVCYESNSTAGTGLTYNPSGNAMTFPAGSKITTGTADNSGAGLTVKMQAVYAPTSSNGTSYGVGSNGQVLKSNGTSIYWASDNAGTSDSKISDVAAAFAEGWV